MSMELDNSFTVPATPDRAWDVLLDVERIAPCMPGATVEEFDGEVVTGRIKVKVGPVALTYRGTAKFLERDPEARVVVLEASGKETRGAGTASATVRASLEPAATGEGTQVVMHTTMNVTGRPAQFGRGVIAEVGGKLVEKFAGNLAQLISDGNAPVADATAAETGAADVADSAAEASSVAVASPAEVASRADVVSQAADASTATDASAATDAGAATDASSVAAGEGTQNAGAESGPATSAVPPAAAVRPSSIAAAATPAAKGDDSLNLVRLVGPAILKRVVPVVAAVAVVALLGRRFRHLLRRGGKG
jgi:carbon monoxide dehydrogenase subunit G